MIRYFSLKTYVRLVVLSIIEKIWFYIKQFKKENENNTILNDPQGRDVLVNHILPFLYKDPKTLANLFCVNKYLKEVGYKFNFTLLKGNNIYSLHYYVNTYLKKSLFLWLCFIERCYFERPTYYFFPCTCNYDELKTIKDMQDLIDDVYRFFIIINPQFNIRPRSQQKIIPLYGSPDNHGHLWYIDGNLSNNYLHYYTVNLRNYMTITGVMIQNIVECVRSEQFKKNILQNIREISYPKAIEYIVRENFDDISIEEIPWFPESHDVYWYFIIVFNDMDLWDMLCVDTNSVTSFFKKK
jgi:hypothetical protein